MQSKGVLQMAKEKYTAEEVIEITIRLLQEIRIPIEFVEDIGIPVRRAIENLRIVLQASNAEKADDEKGGDE